MRPSRIAHPQTSPHGRLPPPAFAPRAGATRSRSCILRERAGRRGLGGERSAGGRKQHGLFRSLLVLTTPALCTRPTQSPYEVDLLNPLPSVEASKHKLKRLVQAPNSFFMDVKCPGCFNMCAPASHPRPPRRPRSPSGRATPRDSYARSAPTA